MTLTCEGVKAVHRSTGPRAVPAPPQGRLIDRAPREHPKLHPVPVASCMQPHVRTLPDGCLRSAAGLFWTAQSPCGWYCSQDHKCIIHLAVRPAVRTIHASIVLHCYPSTEVSGTQTQQRVGWQGRWGTSCSRQVFWVSSAKHSTVRSSGTFR